MESKVTSYEISKRLSELGFKSDSHRGWWGTKIGITAESKWATREIELAHYHVNQVKAYDTWDLLMWLKDQDKFLLEYCVGFQVELEALASDEFWFENGEEQPQNALGLAVIKILEGRK